MEIGRCIRTHSIILALSLLSLVTHWGLPGRAAAGPGPTAVSQFVEDLKSDRPVGLRLDRQGGHRLDKQPGYRLDDRLRLPGLRFLDFGDDGPEGGSGEGDTSRRNDRIVGTSLFASGVFLCSWGITEWEIQEYQCCPARNTGNVVKIVAGIVLLNAGLMYLLGVND